MAKAKETKKQENKKQSVAGLKFIDLEKKEEVKIHFVPVSRDAKVGIMSATYTSCNTCPNRCPFKHAADDKEKDGPCYGKWGPCGLHFRAVSAGISGVAPEELKEKIQSGAHCSTVRHNVAGDIAVPGTDNIDENLVNVLCDAYKSAGVQAYTYTHCEQNDKNLKIMKESTKNGLVINASCEKLEEVKKVMEAGVPAVIAVNTMKEKVATVDGVKIVRCPNWENKEKTCQNCRLCMMKERKFAIAFPVHGPQAKKVQKSDLLMDI